MKTLLKDSLVLLGAGFIFAVGVCVFAKPLKLLTGGASGLALILNSVFSLPIGTGMLIINLPLFVAALIICGKGYALRVLYSTTVFSIIIDVFEAFFELSYSGALWTGSIAAGILCGISSGLLLRQTLVTGGSDLFAYLVAFKKPRYSIALLLLIIDGLIVVLGALLYKSFETAVYSLLLILCMVLVINIILAPKKDRS